MAAKKPPGKQEPLLNTVARKLGHAAGTLTKATHKLTENLSALPEVVTAQVREAANTIAPAKRSRAPKSPVKKRSPAKKKTRTAARLQSVKSGSKAGRRRSAGRKRTTRKRAKR